MASAFKTMNNASIFRHSRLVHPEQEEKKICQGFQVAAVHGQGYGVAASKIKKAAKEHHNCPAASPSAISLRRLRIRVTGSLLSRIGLPMTT